MTPGAPPATPDPRRFFLSRRAPAASQQETPGSRQFQPSGGIGSAGSQRFQTTPRFAPPSSAHTPQPAPSTQVFLLPGSIRSTQRRQQDPIDDVLSSSPAGTPSFVSVGKGKASESVEVGSEVNFLDQNQSIIADSAGEDDGDGPTRKRRRTLPLSECNSDEEDDRVQVMEDEQSVPEQASPSPRVVGEGDDTRLDAPQYPPSPSWDEEMDLSDHEIRREQNAQQQPTFHAAPRFKPSEVEETHTDGLPEAFSPQRRGMKYLPGGMAAEMQSWLADLRGWTGHDRPPDAVMRVVVDEIRPGNRMYLVQGRRIYRAETTVTSGEAAPLRIMLAGEGKLTGLAGRSAVDVGSVVLISQPVWDAPLKGDDRWLVACEWIVEASDNT